MFSRSCVEIDPEYRYRLAYIFNRLLAHGFKAESEFLSDSFGNFARNANPTGLCQLLQLSSDVHSLAVTVFALDDDLSKVNANTDINPPILLNRGIALHHAALKRYGTLNCIN